MPSDDHEHYRDMLKEHYGPMREQNALTRDCLACGAAINADRTQLELHRAWHDSLRDALLKTGRIGPALIRAIDDV